MENTHLKSHTSSAKGGWMAIVIGLLVFAVASSAGAGIVKRHNGYYNGYYNGYPRSKVEFSVGFVSREDIVFAPLPEDVTSHFDLGDMTLSFGYQYQADPNLAVTARVSVLAAESIERPWFINAYKDDFAVVGIFFGLRHYFTMTDPRMPIRPYVGASVGPVIGTRTHQWFDRWLHEDTYTETTIGGQFGGGFDFYIGPHVALNINAGYNAIADFERQFQERYNYSGFEFQVGAGVAF